MPAESLGPSATPTEAVLLDVIERHAGLAPSAARILALRAALARGVLPRRGALDAGHLDALAAAVAVRETWFFREREQLEHVATRLVPGLLRSWPAARRARVLCAGVATGEEAWSLAMCLRDAGAGPRCEVLGVDLCAAAVAHAARGAYGRASFRGAPAAVAAAGLARLRAARGVGSGPCAAVRFAQANLIDGRAPALAGPFDVVLCRNVLMHLSPSGQRAALATLLAALAPGGTLLLGAADPARAARGLGYVTHSSIGPLVRRREAA